jgi:Tol biopolymer transport system component
MANGEDLRLVTRSSRDSLPDWSPKANRIVFQRTKETRDRLGSDVLVAAARPKGHRRPRRLTETRDAYSPVWSPDGRYIAYLRVADPLRNYVGSLWITPAADGRGQRLVAKAVLDERISWQPRPHHKRR